MNKVRIIGLIMIIAGIVIHFAFNNDGTELISGFLVGGGVGFLIGGRIGMKKRSLI